MTTKDHWKHLKDKQDFAQSDNYKNFTLNKSHKCPTAFDHKRSKSVEIKRTKNLNYDITEKTSSQKGSISLKKCHKNLPKDYFSTNFNVASEEEEPGNCLSLNKNSSSSTLSLHIAAYENFNDAEVADSLAAKELKKKGPPTTASKNHEQQSSAHSSFNDRIEFPRQNEDEPTPSPEVQQFIASQKLFTPIQESSTGRSTPQFPSQSVVAEISKAIMIPNHYCSIGRTNNSCATPSKNNEEENIGNRNFGYIGVTEMNNVIFDYSALTSLCTFNDDAAELPKKPLHKYCPDLRLSLTARYSSTSEISYILNAQNTSLHMVHNLTIIVAFHSLPFFDFYTVFDEDCKFDEQVFARAYIDSLCPGSSSICILDLKKPIQPPVLVTFSTTSAIPYPPLSPIRTEIYFKKVIRELQRTPNNVMKLQHSYLITHFDALITYETYQQIRRTSDKRIPMMCLNKKEKNETYHGTACISIQAANTIWNGKCTVEKVYKTFISSLFPRKSHVVGYLPIKDILVELALNVSVDAKGVHIIFLTPLKKLTVSLQKQLEIKFNSLVLLSNHVEECTVPRLNYMEEKEMIQKGRYKVENYTSVLSQHVINLLKDVIEKDLGDNL